MTHGAYRAKTWQNWQFLAVFDKFDGFKIENFIWGFEIWRKDSGFMGFRILHGTNI